MIMLLTALKISALLATILLPLGGPRKKKTGSMPELSGLSVNKNGFLEYFIDKDTDHFSVN